MTRRRSAIAVTAALAGTVLLLCGCASDLAEIPGGAGSAPTRATITAAPTTVATVPGGAATDGGFDLAACIGQSGFTARPEATAGPPDAVAAQAQQLLEDQARFDAIAAECYAEKTATPSLTAPSP